MPEADTTNTRTPPDIVAAILRLATRDGDGELTISALRSPAERELLMDCHAVTVRGEAMRLLTRAVAEVQPTDPRHEASYAVVDQLRPEWTAQLARISATPALGARGITAKATLVASLIQGTEDDCVEGPPVLRIAASLANDLLGLAKG